MILTSAIASRYVLGQFEAQDRFNRCTRRGQIIAATVEGEGADAVLKLTLKWMAVKAADDTWVKHDSLMYTQELRFCWVYDLPNGWLMLYMHVEEEIVTLFPARDLVLLDPSQIEGLKGEH